MESTKTREHQGEAQKVVQKLTWRCVSFGNAAQVSSSVYLFVRTTTCTRIVLAFLMMRKRRVIKISLLPVSRWVPCSLDQDATGPTSPTARCPYDLQMPSWYVSCSSLPAVSLQRPVICPRVYPYHLLTFLSVIKQTYEHIYLIRLLSQLPFPLVRQQKSVEKIVCRTIVKNKRKRKCNALPSQSRIQRT